MDSRQTLVKVSGEDIRDAKKAESHSGIAQSLHVDARTAELNEQCSDDLDRLYTALAEDYMDESEDRFYSFGEKFECSEDIKAFHLHLRSEDSHHQSEWDYAVDHTVSTFRIRMEELNRLKRPETNDEIALAQPFPQSIEEYRQKPQGMQYHVARFLMLELDEQRESMLSEFDWAWTQVTQLNDEFHANPEFQEEIRRTIATLNDNESQ
ncbi:hypothetical protein B0H12DRAFT_1219174 [Mycena haematopus]|nr:hypothetical protein B0H12DRAFT_1219174 [Mycena haematopus]